MLIRILKQVCNLFVKKQTFIGVLFFVLQYKWLCSCYFRFLFYLLILIFADYFINISVALLCHYKEKNDGHSKIFLFKHTEFESDYYIQRLSFERMVSQAFGHLHW